MSQICLLNILAPLNTDVYFVVFWHLLNVKSSSLLSILIFEGGV